MLKIDIEIFNFLIPSNYDTFLETLYQKGCKQLVGKSQMLRFDVQILAGI